VTVRSRRSTELLLLLAAAPAVLLIFGLVDAQATETLSWRDFAVPAGLIAAFIGAHVAVRFLAPAADPVLLPLTALLSGIGVAYVTRLNPVMGAQQVLWLFVGVAAMVATLVAVPSLERLARYKYTVMLAGLGLLVLPTIIGVEINGAQLWLRVAGMSFQPGEVAKVLIVLFLAAYLAENREVLSVSTRRVLGIGVPALRHLGPLLFMWAVSLFVLVSQKDLGSSLLFFGIFLVMIYVATGRLSYVVIGLLLFAAGAAAAYSLFSHVQTRVEIWLDPFADAVGRGYQLVQSIFALAAGQVTGVGVGRGFPGRIPFVETDFIFAAIGEELGLLGGAALIITYLVFCMRGLATAARARSDMAAFTATGLVAALGLQTFVIIGGVTGSSRSPASRFRSCRTEAPRYSQLHDARPASARRRRGDRTGNRDSLALRFFGRARTRGAVEAALALGDGHRHHARCPCGEPDFDPGGAGAGAQQPSGQHARAGRGDPLAAGFDRRR
jgi:cell division protein FtsW (lipid II flippase)